MLKDDEEVPLLFTDDAFTQSSRWRLSTSHCGSKALKLFGFGPVVSDGFGVGYAVKNDNISFCVTGKANARSHRTHPAIFASVLERSLLQLMDLIIASHEHLQQIPASLEFSHPTLTYNLSYRR